MVQNRKIERRCISYEGHVFKPLALPMKDLEKDFQETFPVIEKIPYNPIFVKAMIEKNSVLEIDSEDIEVQKIKNMLIELSNFVLEKTELDN